MYVQLDDLLGERLEREIITKNYTQWFSKYSGQKKIGTYVETNHFTRTVVRKATKKVAKENEPKCTYPTAQHNYGTTMDLILKEIREKTDKRSCM